MRPVHAVLIQTFDSEALILREVLPRLPTPPKKDPQIGHPKNGSIPTLGNLGDS